MKCIRVLTLALTAWAASIGSSVAAEANLAFTQLPQVDGGATSVFYPTSSVPKEVSQGPFRFNWAADAQPIEGNRRLVVISHGSGGSPWVHVDLARLLVSKGFVVAIPQHKGDNYIDGSEPGPASWARRPQEVSQAIDRIGTDARFAPLLSVHEVGVFGGSAGGHTALSLAGGVWSPKRFLSHCEQNIEADFSSCVGFVTLLKGNWLDGPKRWLALSVLRSRFDDETRHQHAEPRVRVVIAMVPFAADFEPESLAEPRVSLGLVRAANDVNQVPRFHIDAVLKACKDRCTLIQDLREGGHGAMLSPLPPLEDGSIAKALLGDPQGFNRVRELPELNERIAEFFVKELKIKQ